MPLLPVFGNVFEVGILRERLRRSLESPTWNPGISVRGVSNHSEKVRNRLRSHAEFCDHARFIADSLPSAIHLHDARSHNALAEVLIRRANKYLRDALI